MIWTVLKWGVLPLLLIVAAAALFTKKSFHVETIIAAPPEAIWAILVDTESYSEWNPVFVGIDGKYRENEAVKNSVRFPDGSIVEMQATVQTLTENRELRQSGGMPGLLTFDHQWLLEPVEGGTRVVQQETDRGLWLWFWNSDWIEPAYQSVLAALDQRAKQNN